MTELEIKKCKSKRDIDEKAWIYATSIIDSVRNGKKGIRGEAYFWLMLYYLYYRCENPHKDEIRQIKEILSIALGDADNVSNSF